MSTEHRRPWDVTPRGTSSRCGHLTVALLHIIAHDPTGGLFACEDSDLWVSSSNLLICRNLSGGSVSNQTVPAEVHCMTT